jgi:hypothetical protein
MSSIDLPSAEDALRQAVEELYSTFKIYDIAKPIDGCDHCVSKEDISLLLSKPLRELTWRELDKYPFKALTTFGDLNDFKKFLPRICDLLAFDGDNSGTDWPVALGKIDYAQREYSPAPSSPAFDDREMKTIGRFLLCWWMRTLHSPPADPIRNSQDVLETIGCATPDLKPFLNCWSASPELHPALHLAAMVNDHATDIFKSRKINFIFWDELPDRKEQLSAWLRGDIPRTILEEAIEKAGDAVTELEISNAHRVLEFLEASSPT